MHPALLSLLLIAVHAPVPLDCKATLRDPERLRRHRQSGVQAGGRADGSAAAGRFLLGVRRRSHGGLLVVLPARPEGSAAVSMAALRRRRGLCVDSRGNPLSSKRREDRDHCLLRLRLLAARQEPPEPSWARPQGLLGSLMKRKRRSEEVNPSDPLRTHSRPSTSVQDHQEADRGQPEQDQAGAVSKETISSCDDPLRVLQPNGPVSPVKTNIAEQD